jgi:hypothetical protein
MSGKLEPLAPYFSGTCQGMPAAISSAMAALRNPMAGGGDLLLERAKSFIRKVFRTSS